MWRTKSRMRRASMPDERRQSGSEGGLELEVSVVSGRGLWAGRLDFFLSCLGYAVGLGNLWRFPTMCYSNGGGAFLVPYILFLVVGGIPLVFLEMCVGQFASLGPITIWRMAPIFKGVGYGMVIASFFVGVYYNLLLAWAIYYLFASMQKHIPWDTCGNTWNSKYCCEQIVYRPNCSIEDTQQCITCPSNNITANSLSSITSLNWSIPLATSVENTSKWLLPAEEYFYNHVMGVSGSSTANGAWTLGEVQWQVALCLLAAWILVFLCLVNGIRASGKIVYVTVVFPYLMLTVLLVGALMLPGSTQGIIFYLKPDWTKLKQPKVWHDAASQVVFSLSPCYGGLITLASYNSFSNNCYRDALLVSVLNALTSIYAGFPIFATLGYMAHQLGSSVDSVVSSGPGLVFAVWPTALSGLAGQQAWLVLFFLMLLMVGLDSQLIYVHTIVTAIHDEILAYKTTSEKQQTSKMRRERKNRGSEDGLQPRTQKRVLLLVLCFVMFLAGIPLCTQGGIHLFRLVDRYATDWSVLVLGVLECIVIGWVYGYPRFAHDVWSMFGKRPGRWWRIMWQVGTPLCTLFVLLTSVVLHDPVEYYGEEGLTPIGSPIGSAIGSGLAWSIAGLGVLVVPLYAIIAVCRAQGTIPQRVRGLLKPSKEWGPAWEIPELRGTLTCLPDYMISEKEEGIPNPVLVKERSINFSQDDMEDSVSMVGSYHGNRPPRDPKDEVDDLLYEDIDTGSMEWAEDENKRRGNWTGRMDFLLAGAGYCIGIGNVWRFPYLVYKNGGGAFFLPYMVMVIFCGLPIFFMEVAFGQFASTGPISVWRVSPIFKGMGYCVCLTVFLITIYYNMINAWSVYYLFASMTSGGHLPWASCNNTWNTDMCRLRSEFNSNLTTPCNSSTYNKTLVSLPGSILNLGNSSGCSGAAEGFDGVTGGGGIGGDFNGTSNGSTAASEKPKFVTPAEEYFFREVLDMSPGVGELGSVRWPLALALLFCWFVTFISLVRGVKSIGKVVYVTSTLPQLVLLILLVRYISVDPAAHLDGIRYYVTPTWNRLTNAEVWGDAAGQLFFSLGLSQGGLIALASFNRFHYDCYRDAYIICLLDTLTSVFAGFVVFAILGVMAKEANMELKEVVSSSFTLAYVVFAEAVTKLEVAWAWSILIFLMFFLLAIDSHFIMVYGLVTAIVDEFQLAQNKQVYVAAGLCITAFLLGVPLTTQGGLYLLVLMDTYVGAWSTVCVGLLMCVVLGWVYKIGNFSANIKVMLGHSPGWFWSAMWKFITPAILGFILVFSWIHYKGAPVLAGGYIFPGWAHGLGLMLAVLPLLCIPITALVQVALSLRAGCAKGSFPNKALILQSQPDLEWGPALDKHRAASYLPHPTPVTDTKERVQQWMEEGTFTDIFRTSTSASMPPLAPVTEATEAETLTPGSTININTANGHEDTIKLDSSSNSGASPNESSCSLLVVDSEPPSEPHSELPSELHSELHSELPSELPLESSFNEPIISQLVSVSRTLNSLQSLDSTNTFGSPQYASSKKGMKLTLSEVLLSRSTKQSMKKTANSNVSNSSKRFLNGAVSSPRPVPVGKNAAKKRWRLGGSTSTSPDDSIVSGILTSSLSKTAWGGKEKNNRIRPHNPPLSRRRRQDSRVTFKEEETKDVLICPPRDPAVPMVDNSAQTQLHYWDLVGKATIPIVTITSQPDCLNTLFPSQHSSETITLHAEVHSSHDDSDDTPAAKPVDISEHSMEKSDGDTLTNSVENSPNSMEIFELSMEQPDSDTHKKTVEICETAMGKTDSGDTLTKLVGISADSMENTDNGDTLTKSVQISEHSLEKSDGDATSNSEEISKHSVEKSNVSTSTEMPQPAVLCSSREADCQSPSQLVSCNPKTDFVAQGTPLMENSTMSLSFLTNSDLHNNNNNTSKQAGNLDIEEKAEMTTCL